MSEFHGEFDPLVEMVEAGNRLSTGPRVSLIFICAPKDALTGFQWGRNHFGLLEERDVI